MKLTNKETQNLTKSRFGGIRVREEFSNVPQGHGSDEDPVADDGGDDDGGENGDEDDDDVSDVEVVVVLVGLVHHLAHYSEMRMDTLMDTRKIIMKMKADSITKDVS